MHIPHIDDLTLEQFLYVLDNIRNFEATEKIDGSNLIFGFDKQGQFYTKRSFERTSYVYYQESDYPMVSTNNGFRIAHQLLQSHESHFRLIMNAGDAVEIEVLYGQQPNTIIYGENIIVFLHSLSRNLELMKHLRQEFAGLQSQTFAPAIITYNGIDLEQITYESTWKFMNVPKISPLIMQQVSVYEEAEDFKEWLKSNPNTLFKNKKEYKKAYLPKMLAIKEILLNQIVRKTTSPLRTCKVPIEEDFGIEGIVLYNPEINVSVKLVDRKTFFLINQFYYAIRNQIKNTSWFNKNNHENLYQTFNVTLTDISIYDQFFEIIAKKLGLDGFNKYMSLTRDLKKFPSFQDFLLQWKVTNMANLKSDMEKIVISTIKSTEHLCNKFKQEYNDYILVLSNGQVIKYNPNIRNRTLLVFAELISDFKSMIQKIQNSNTIEDVAHVLYGQKLNVIINKTNT